VFVAVGWVFVTVMVNVAVEGITVLVLVGVLVAVDTAAVFVAVKISSGPRGCMFVLFEQENVKTRRAAAKAPRSIVCFFMLSPF
jgi:hypothetical protein